MMATSRIAPYTIVRPLDWDIWLRTFFCLSGFSSWRKNLSSSATSGVVVADEWYHCPLVANVVTTWKQMPWLSLSASHSTCLQFYTRTKVKILVQMHQGQGQAIQSNRSKCETIISMQVFSSFGTMTKSNSIMAAYVFLCFYIGF